MQQGNGKGHRPKTLLVCAMKSIHDNNQLLLLSKIILSTVSQIQNFLNTVTDMNNYNIWGNVRLVCQSSVLFFTWHYSNQDNVHKWRHQMLHQSPQKQSTHENQYTSFHIAMNLQLCQTLLWLALNNIKSTVHAMLTSKSMHSLNVDICANHHSVLHFRPHQNTANDWTIHACSLMWNYFHLLLYLLSNFFTAILESRASIFPCST